MGGEFCRSDGRGLDERRKVQLHCSACTSSPGTAMLRFGDSTVLAGVVAEVNEAVPDVAALGHITVTIDFPSFCNGIFRERGRAAGLSAFISGTLHEILNSSHVFDPAQLNIREGELYWVLNVHIVCLNFDGNAFDLCLISALAALNNVTLPSLLEEKDATGRCQLVAVPDTRAGIVSEARKIALSSKPIPVTVTRLPENVWVVDPTVAEEEAGTSVTLCLMNDQWIVHQRGGRTSVDQYLSKLMPTARSCLPDLLALFP